MSSPTSTGALPHTLTRCACRSPACTQRARGQMHRVSGQMRQVAGWAGQAAWPRAWIPARSSSASPISRLYLADIPPRSRLDLGEVLIGLLEVPRHRVLLHLGQRVGRARLEVLEDRLDLVRGGAGDSGQRSAVRVRVRLRVRVRGQGLLHPSVVELLAHHHLPRRRLLARRPRRPAVSIGAVRSCAISTLTLLTYPSPLSLALLPLTPLYRM